MPAVDSLFCRFYFYVENCYNICYTFLEVNVLKENIDNQLDLTKNILYNSESEIALEYATWMKEKAHIKFEKNIPCFLITANYIYWCDLGINIGSEQNKIRPVLIVKTHKNSTVCTVIPLTSERMNDSRWYHVDLEDQNSTAIIEQLRNVSKLRILSPMRKKGHVLKITQNDWENINKALTSYYTMTPWK